MSSPAAQAAIEPWRLALAARLRELRQAQHLTVKSLAHQAGMYWIELERYEQAEQLPDISKLYVIASLLQTTLHDLLPPQSIPSCAPQPYDELLIEE